MGPLLLPAAQEASKNVDKLVQEVWTERKVECVVLFCLKNWGMMRINVMSASECLSMDVHVQVYGGSYPKLFFKCVTSVCRVYRV